MTVYYGEINCESKTAKGTECTNKAYWKVGKKYLCGVHSKNKDRKELPKGKKKEPSIDWDNIKELKKGKVICSKMKMMKGFDTRKGYLNVFPNYKHQNRKDGFGCSSLSPMSLGPVKHKQEGLPDALNIENYFQSNKKFPCESMKKFRKKRLEMYEDPIPHRHKYDRKLGNIPEYSIFIINGEERQYTYIQSRYFYCHFYERLAKKTDDYKKLRKYLYEKKYGLNIVGYDAYPITKDLYSHYKDSSKPFGHELVLYCLLTLEKEEYPWRIYYNKHKKLYT